MKHILLPCVATSLAGLAWYDAAPRAASACLSAGERVAIEATADDALLELRAGAPFAPLDVGASERAVLREAQAAEPGLLELRGGDLTHDEWTILGVALFGVIVLAILI